MSVTHMPTQRDFRLSHKRDEARAKVRATNPDNADLPDLGYLITCNGQAWLNRAANRNVRYIAPYACVSCNGHIFRIAGSCVACALDSEEDAE